MAEAGGIVCEVESSFASGLIRALESVRDGEADNQLLASWLAVYRADEINSGQLIVERGERFKKVNGSFASFLQSYQISTAYRADGAAREYLRGMEDALTKMITIDEGMSEDAEELREMLRAGELEPLAERLAALASADGATATKRYLEGYERRLQDNGFLMEELNRVLAVEYSSKLDSARTRFTGSVESLSESSRRIGRQIADIDRNVEDLSRDESVRTEDKRVFLSTFVRRRAELLSSMKAHQLKALVVSALLAEYHSVTSRVSIFLERLRLQLAQLAARRDYIRRLKSAGSEAPKLTAIDEVNESLYSNAETLQEAFLLLDEAFIDEILAVIDSNRSVGSVTVRLKETPQIAFVVSPEPSVGETLPRLDLGSFIGLSTSLDSNGRAPRGAHRSRRSIRPARDPAPHPKKEAP